MNIEYTHINNKAIIKDELGNTKIVPYYDNLYDVLVRENLLEEIEKEINRVILDKEKYKCNKYFIPMSTPILLLAVYFGTTILMNYCGIPKEELSVILNTKFGPMNIIDITQITMSIPALLFGLTLDITAYNSYNNIKKIRNAKDTQIEYLKKDLNSIKEELEKLKKNKKNTNIQMDTDYEVKIIEDIYVKKLKNISDFYYNLGYDEKKLYKKYLKEKLDKVYDDYYLELAKKHFDEKGPVLAKKYDKK